MRAFYFPEDGKGHMNRGGCFGIGNGEHLKGNDREKAH